MAYRKSRQTKGPRRTPTARTQVSRASDSPGRVWSLSLRGETSLLRSFRTFVLRIIAPDAHPGRCPGTEEASDWFKETVDYWQRWAARCTYRGRWRETVLRSALALKLLTYQPTGAIVAALTTSLPEGIGGVRNWDYRYTWIRDAAFTVYAFLRVGFTEEAVRFMDWLAARWKERDSHCDGPLQLMS